MNYIKPVNHDEVIEDLEKRYAYYLFQISIYEAILPILKSWVGKKITKVLGNKIAAILKPLGYDRVYYYHEHDSYNVTIWVKDKETNREERNTLYFGTKEYFSEDRLSEFTEQLKRFHNWKNELEEMELDEVKTTVSEWNMLLEQMKAVYSKASKLHISGLFKLT